MSQKSPLKPFAGRGRWVLAGVATVVVAACVIGAFVVGRTTGDSDAPPAQPARKPAVAAPDVQTQDVAGVQLPFSQIHGPRATTDGQAAGYSRSEFGAALAAVQVLARTSPSAGPDVFTPVLASQVTGTNLPAMKLAVVDEYQRLRAATPVADGKPIPGNDGSVAGYVIRSYQDDTAAVDVLLTSSTLQAQQQMVSFAVQLVWQADDWRVVAPPNGDWGSVATTLGAPPDGLRRYDA